MRGRLVVKPAQALAFAALLLPSLAVFAPKAAVPLFALCAALALLAPEGRAAARGAFRGPVVWALAALGAWAFAAGFWSPDPPGALTLWLRLVVLFAAALALRVVAGALEDSAPLRRALPLGFVLGLALAAFEIASGSALRAAYEGVADPNPYIGGWLNRGMTALALIVWPAAAALWPKSPAKALALLAAGGLALLAGPQRAAKLAFLLALPIAALAWCFAARLRVLLAALAVVLCLGAPLLPRLLPDAAELRAAGVAESLSHRVQIWEFAAARIAERPLLGWGFDASRAIPGGDAAAPGTVGRLLPLHPHNGALQVWLELGAVGALALAAILAQIWAAAAALPQPHARAAAAALVASALTIGSVSYGVWQTQWLSMLALAAAFMVGAARPARS